MMTCNARLVRIIPFGWDGNKNYLKEKMEADTLLIFMVLEILWHLMEWNSLVAKKLEMRENIKMSLNLTNKTIINSTLNVPIGWDRFG